MLEGAKLIGAGAATIALAGAAVGIGNVFSSLISSVARNPSLAKFGYAIFSCTIFSSKNAQMSTAARFLSSSSDKNNDNLICQVEVETTADIQTEGGTGTGVIVTTKERGGNISRAKEKFCYWAELLRPLVGRLTKSIALLGLNLTFGGFGLPILVVLTVQLSIAEAYCVGAEIIAHTETEPMKHFQNIDEEDARSYLFRHWKDFEALAKSCEKGHLPSPSSGYEIIQQLSPTQLRSILRAITIGLQARENGEESGREFQQIFHEIEHFTGNLLKVFEEIVPGLSLLTGISLPLSMPLEEALPLLLKVKLSSEKAIYYSSQILGQVTPLLDAYYEAFQRLPQSPELLFPEPEIACESSTSNLLEFDIPESEKTAIEAVHAKAKRAFSIAEHIHRTRKRFRYSANQSDPQISEE